MNSRHASISALSAARISLLAGVSIAALSFQLSSASAQSTTVTPAPGGWLGGPLWVAPNGNLSASGDNVTGLTFKNGSGTNTTITGTGLTTNGAVSTGTLTTTGAATVNGAFVANGNSTLNNGLTVYGGSTLNNGTTLNGGATVNGASTVNGSATVNGASAVNGSATVNGVSTVNGSATVNGVSTVNGSATVNGASTVNGSATVNGITTLNGSAIINGASTVNGSATVNGTSTLNGNTTVNGTATVSGQSYLNGGATVSNNLTVTPNTNVNMGNNVVHGVATPIVGTDAANKAYVDKGVNKAFEGTALALAISQPVFLPGQTFAVRGGWGDYEGRGAFGLSAAGVVGRFNDGSTVTLDAGVGIGADYGGVAGKAGVTLGFGGGSASLK